MSVTLHGLGLKLRPNFKQTEGSEAHLMKLKLHAINSVVLMQFFFFSTKLLDHSL